MNVPNIAENDFERAQRYLGIVLRQRETIHRLVLALQAQEAFENRHPMQDTHESMEVRAMRYSALLSAMLDAPKEQP